MRGREMLAAIAAVTILVASLAGPVAANDSDVIRTGNCSSNSDWKLKVGLDNGRIDVEFEVDQNRIGKTWYVRLKDNGTVFWKGYRTTLARLRARSRSTSAPLTGLAKTGLPTTESWRTPGTPEAARCAGRC